MIGSRRLTLVIALASVSFLLLAGLVADLQAADQATKKAKIEANRARGLTPVQSQVVSSDAERLAPTGTAWLVYDDDSAEGWGFDLAPTYAVAGNKFVSTWGTFYCDIVQMCMRFATDTSGFMSAYNGLSGSTLQNNTYLTIFPGTTTAWLQVDGSTSAVGWVGNSAYVFNNTAWIGNDFYGECEVGLDTNGGGSHGFAVTAYAGSGYAEQSWNAMVRARFNGDNVPVELMSFTAE